MIRSKQLPAFLAILLVIPSIAVAQHDPHRNSVRHIASASWDAFAKELAKADESDPETQFVRALAALQRDRIEEAEKHARKALEAGMSIDRFEAGPLPELQPLQQQASYQAWVKKYKPSSLLHGPMLGALTADSVQVWLRTTKPSPVRVEVLDADGQTVATASAATKQRDDRTAVLKLSGLKPLATYTYRVTVADEVIERDSFRISTPARKGEASRFRVGIGGGAGFVPKWERMWDTIIATKPDAFLMLGDNVYIDDPTHRLTTDYCYYRRQCRPEWRRLVSQTAMYAIYDDHDFGTNDCIPGPEIDNPKWKRRVWNEFRTNWVNPSYGGGDDQPGCWFDFYIGDVHFILLDGRYYRNRKGEPTMLGPVQREWLEKTLRESKGVFKILTSPVPWSPGIKPGSKDPWDGFPRERDEIFSFIAEEKIEGVVLAAADRHRSDLRITERPGAYPLYEFESSKLTNRHTHKVVSTKGLVWGYNKKCSFGLMEFDTTAPDPTLRFEVHSIDGELIHSHQIKRSQLSFER